jgi:hypothetical protein
VSNKDLHNDLEYRPLIAAVTQTNDDTAIVSAVIDRAGFESLELVVITGTVSDPDVTFVCLVEDGATDAVADGAVNDAFLLGVETGLPTLATADSKTFKIGYIGTKRYVRLTITPTGNNAGNVPIAAIAVLGGARVKPKTTQAVA